MSIGWNGMEWKFLWITDGLDVHEVCSYVSVGMSSCCGLVYRDFIHTCVRTVQVQLFILNK